MESTTAVAEQIDESTQPVEEKLTRKKIKEILRWQWTVRRPVVLLCGHKIDLGNDPKNNCPYCWFMYFNNHGELVQTVDELFQKHGPQGVEQMRGTKFLKQFIRFMVTLNEMKKMEANEQSVSGTGSGSEESETGS